MALYTMVLTMLAGGILAGYVITKDNAREEEIFE